VGKMMKIALWLVAGLLLLIATVMVIGRSLPVKHVAARQLRLKAPAERIWSAISDFKDSVYWRSDLKSAELVEISPDAFGWREVSRSGAAITYLTVEATPTSHLVRRIVDQDLPFGGSWTFELRPSGTDSVLTVTEHGEIYNPVFRFMARFVFGYHTSLDRYLSDLEKHLEQ
jgi:hypothetical protein